MMNKPSPVDNAGKALGAFFIIVGWIAGMFLLFMSPSNTLALIALVTVEVLFYIVGLLMLIIFSEEG